MKVQQVIKEVFELQQKFFNTEAALSVEYLLEVTTNGDDWMIKFLGFPVMHSEEFDEEQSLEDQILIEMKNIQEYLNTVLEGR